MATPPPLPPPLPRAPARSRRRVDVRLALSLLLFVAALGVSGYLLWIDPQAHASTRIETRVLGQTVDNGGDPWLRCTKLARAYLRQPVTLQLGDTTHERTREALGVRVELTALSQLLRAAADPGSPLRRLHAQQRGQDAALDLPVPAHIEGEQALVWLRALAQRFDVAPRPTRVELSSGVVRKARPGRKLDVQATLDALEDAVFRGEQSVRAKVSVTQPPRHSATRGKLDLSTTLGSFESSVDAPDRTRMHNLASAARRLDGVLIEPGEIFDLRAMLGDVRGESPFRLAPVQPRDGDPLEAALGQVASTVYAAALFAGLPIIEQHPRARPGEELEPGLDAALDAQHNLRFRNDLTVPVVLAVGARAGNVRAVLRGAKPRAHDAREVELGLLVDEVTPYPELTLPDPSLPDGVRVIAQRGVPGLRVVLKRSVHPPGEPAESSEERVTSYAPSPRLVRVGTGSIDLETLVAQPGDTRSELMLDEQVEYSMRPGFELPEATLRQGGRTREPDWTASAGP